MARKHGVSEQMLFTLAKQYGQLEPTNTGAPQSLSSRHELIGGLVTACSSVLSGRLRRTGGLLGANSVLENWFIALLV